MDEFKQLSQDEVISIISQNDILASEEELCEAVLKWVKFDPDTRKSQLCKVLQNVRFPLMCSSYIEDLTMNELIWGSQEIKLMLLDIFASLCDPDPSSPVHQKVADLPQQFKHRQEEMLCLIGTRSGHRNPQSTEMKCFSFHKDTQYSLTALPVEPGASFAVCSYKDDIYVSGGCRGKKLFLQYNSSEIKWQHCSPMIDGRCGHSMVTIGDRIYVLGGSTKSSQTLSSIEMYNPQLNECSIFGDLQIPVSFMPTAALGSRIYIFGGKLHDGTTSTKIQCFDTEKRTCFVLGDMPRVSSIAKARAVAIEDSIYIFGCHGDILRYKKDSPVTKVRSMPHLDDFCVTPHKGKIMIVGSKRNKFLTSLFDPLFLHIMSWTRNLNTGLCDFAGMSVVLSRPKNGLGAKLPDLQSRLSRPPKL